MYVLGAGASMPYDMPSGSQLKQSIVEKLSNSGLADIIASNHNEAHQMRLLEANFKASPIESIDAYLEANPDQLEIGKKLIAACLFEAEAQCTIEDPNTKRHWLKYLFNALRLSRSPENLSEIAFVSFNYDSLVERFFDFSFRKAFNIPESEANPHIDHLHITHVHGSLIKNPAQIARYLKETKHPICRENKYFRNSLVYGLDDDDDWEKREYNHAYAHYVEEAAVNLRLVQDRRGDAEAQKLLSETERIIFLGFSYDADNLAKILPPNIERRLSALKGTAYGMSHGEIKRIPYLSRYESHVPNSLVSNFYENIDCLDLLRGEHAIPPLSNPSLIDHCIA